MRRRPVPDLTDLLAGQLRASVAFWVRFGSAVVLLALLCYSPCVGVEYLSFKQALARAFPTSGKIEQYKLQLSAAELATLEKVSAASPMNRGSLAGIYLGHSNNTLDGILLVDHVIGRTEYITYGCVLTKAGAVKDVFVMVYREPVGSEVRRPNFLRQFHGKTPADDIRLKKTIINISGATMSCRGISSRMRFLLQVYKSHLKKTLPAWVKSRESAPAKVKDGEAGAWLRRAVPAGSHLLELQLPHAQAGMVNALMTCASLRDQQWNAWRRDGPWAALEKGGRITLDADCARIVSRARELHVLSGGCFDPSVRPVLQYWWDCAKQQRVPDAGELQKKLALTGYSRIEFGETDAEMFLPSGWSLDFSAMRKGMVVDELIARGPERMRVSFGGSSWFSKGVNSLIAIPEFPGAPCIDLPRDRALSVSHSGKQTLEIAGRVFGHLLDPRSGQLISPDKSAIVIAARSDLADVLSTACCILPVKHSRALLLKAGAAALIWDGAEVHTVGSVARRPLAELH